VYQYLRLSLQHAGLGQTHVSDFIQRIRSIADQLAQEDFFVAVEGVDDKTEQLQTRKSEVRICRI
jgi:hypothetical protein